VDQVQVESQRPTGSSGRLEFSKNKQSGGRTVAQYKITLSEEDLHRLFCGDGGLARLVQKVPNQILSVQVTEALGAKPYERTDSRQGYRNGFRR